MADFERLRLFLADNNADASRRAIIEIIRAIDSLAVFPDRGRLIGNAGLRELSVPFGRSGYVVRFIHDPFAAEIVVIRVWHGREQRP